MNKNFKNQEKFYEGEREPLELIGFSLWLEGRPKRPNLAKSKTVFEQKI